jgi:hypothetical protein
VRGIVRALSLAAFVSLAAGRGQADILGTVDLGLVRDDRPVTAVYTLRNPSRDKVARVDLLSGCGCLEARPDMVVLEPGEARDVTIVYTPEPYRGDTWMQRNLLVRSTLPELDNQRVVVKASFAESARPAFPTTSDCDECRRMEEQFGEERLLGLYSVEVLLVDFYFDPGCRDCDEYLERGLPSAAQHAGKVLRLARHSILDPAALEQLVRRLDGQGQALTRLPVAFVGDRACQGLDAIREGVRAALAPR